MKSISASIVILSAAVLITGGAFISHNDTQLFVQAVGCLTGVAGFIGWVVTFRNDNT